MPVERRDRPPDLEQVAQLGPVEELRRAVAARGGSAGDLALEPVLEAIGDVDLAATALTMKPRPKWVSAAADAALCRE